MNNPGKLATLGTQGIYDGAKVYELEENKS